MAHYSVVTAVEDRTKANFSRCPVYVENELTDTPADGSAWLVIQFPFATTEWIEVEGPDGSGFQEEGAFRFVLSVPRGDGAHSGRQWLGELADLFRGQLFDGVQTFAPDSPIGDDDNDIGSVYRLAMAVPYQFTFNG